MTLRFPDLAVPSYPLEEIWEDPAIRSDFEAGYEQTRARYPRQRKTWGLTWEALRDADKERLESFWRSTLGGSASFLWTHPLDGTSHAVRFVSVPRIRKTLPGRWAAELQLREV